MSRGKFTRPYVVWFTDAMTRIAADKDLTGNDIKVLMAVYANAPIEGGEWDTDTRAVATITGMADTVVQRHLRRLDKAGYLRRPRRGKVAFAPRIAWRGKAENNVYAKLAEAGIITPEAAHAAARQ